MASVLRSGKPTGSTNSSARPVEYAFSDMGTQGVDYVASVRAEAAKEVAQAKAEAAKIRKEAEAKGQADAEATIAKMLDARVGGEIQTLKPALDNVVREIQAHRGEWIAYWRSAAIQLAAAMAEKIVRRELQNDTTISEGWIAEALELAAGSSEITVRLSPSDFEHLHGHAERLKESIAGLGEMRFVSDEQISAGGCRVETRHGSIDQQLENQLDRLQEELS